LDHLPDVSASCPQSGVAGRFPRERKLLRHADFQRVYQQGRRHFAAHMTVFYLRRENVRSAEMAMFPASGPRIGLTVGKVLGGSVERNRIKRRLREAVRASLAELGQPVDVVINPKKSAMRAEFAVLREEVARAFQKIESSVAGRQSSEQSSVPSRESREGAG
jgi:ribonuclease P protein component